MITFHSSSYVISLYTIHLKNYSYYNQEISDLKSPKKRSVLDVFISNPELKQPGIRHKSGKKIHFNITTSKRYYLPPGAIMAPVTALHVLKI